MASSIYFHFLSSFLSSLLLPYYFSLSDDSIDASFFESSSSSWWPYLSCLIKLSAPLRMISSRRPLCKQSGNFIAPFCTVSLQLQVFGSFMDKEGFCRSIFSGKTCCTHTPVLILLWVYRWCACWVGLRCLALQTTLLAWNMSVSSCNLCGGLY